MISRDKFSWVGKTVELVTLRPKEFKDTSNKKTDKKEPSLKSIRTKRVHWLQRLPKLPT
mgnify:CR=1 FL=1|jgi:hypothetical protein